MADAAPSGWANLDIRHVGQILSNRIEEAVIDLDGDNCEV